MEHKKGDDKNQLLSEAEIKIEIQRQIELQKRIDLQRQADEQKLKEQIEKEKSSLLNFIVEQAEALTPKKNKKKNAQDEVLKKYLTSVGVTSDKEQTEIISNLKRPYKPHFQYEKGYYKEMFRLNLWNEDAYTNYYKPREVAVWTVRLIYGRFMKELPTIMDELRAKNKYIGFCIRRYKFFQFLTPEAQIKLDKFIEDCVDMMKQYSDWGTFEKEYCDKYELPYQMRLFE